MDIYRILEKLAVISNKQTLTEGQMKRSLEARAENMSKADFVANAGEYGMSAEEAAEFWAAVNGEEEVDEAYDKLPVDQLGLDKFSQAALSGGQRKRDALANPNQTRMLAKKSAQQRPVREAGEAFAKGDRVMYLNGFATVVGQDGDAYFVKVDGQPNTMKVPATAIKKPSYNEGVSKSKKAKPDFLDVDKDGNKKESFKKAVQDKKVDESAKPDFLDLDKDGNKKEPMKKAAKDKNDAKGSFQKQMGGSAKDLTKGLSIGAKKVSEQLDEVFPGTPEYELRFGKDDVSSAFDKKKISTGTVYTRKHQEEPEATDDDTPKKKGRPVGAKRRLGAKGPSVNSLLLKDKGGLKEHDDDIDIRDRGEYDREGDMALNQIHQIADAVKELHSILDADANLPEWVQSKITKALDYIDTARDYLDAEGDQEHEMIPEKAVSRAQQQAAGAALAAKRGKGKAIGASKEMAKMSTKELEKFAATKHKGLPAKKVDEESTDKEDQRAERAGKRVSRDLEYDMKHQGKDDNKAERAGKRVTKDIEYDDKKDKKKEVDETTVAGSVATSAAPAKSKGGMQFGKGVYEGALAESFEKKMKQLNESYSVNVSVDDGGRKNITVTASDEQADQLGQMLKMAGLFSSEGYSRVCEHCHGIHEAGSCGIEQVEEELANAPNEQYSDTDTMVNTLSGGLNGPKLQSNPNNMGDNPLAMSRLGNTAAPSLNLGDVAESVEKESTTRLWDLYRDYKAK